MNAQAHWERIYGLIGFADSIQERDGLSFLSLRLLSGNFLRHGQILYACETGHISWGYSSSRHVIRMPVRQMERSIYTAETWAGLFQTDRGDA